MILWFDDLPKQTSIHSSRCTSATQLKGALKRDLKKIMITDTVVQTRISNITFILLLQNAALLLAQSYQSNRRVYFYFSFFFFKHMAKAQISYCFSLQGSPFSSLPCYRQNWLAERRWPDQTMQKVSGTDYTNPGSYWHIRSLFTGVPGFCASNNKIQSNFSW